LGTASALARVSGGPSTPLVGTLRADLSDAQIAHKLASRRTERTRIGSGTVTVSATPALVTAQADLGDGEVGTIHGKLEAQRSTARGTLPGEPLAHWQDMPLTAELHVQTHPPGHTVLIVPH